MFGDIGLGSVPLPLLFPLHTLLFFISLVSHLLCSIFIDTMHVRLYPAPGMLQIK